MNNHTEDYPDVISNASVDFWTAVNLSPATKAVPILYKVWSPCLLLLGGFGNVAAIFVLHRIKDHNSSQHVFLIALAVIDLTCLYTRLVPTVLDSYFNVDVMNLHSATCKLFAWLLGVPFRLSAWLVTAVTVQRTLAIKWPHKIRVMCTVRRTWTVVAALVFAACALNSHILVMFRVQDNVCYYYRSSSYEFFIRYINSWLNLCLTSFLPFVCLLVCDVILTLSLFQASSTTSVANQAISNVPSVQNDNSRRETARRTTVMILALSVAFFILTLPLEMVITWYNLMREQINKNPKLYAKMLLMNTVGWLLVSTNSAINFFLYCFTGTRFRREFLNWICCRVGDPSSGSVGKTVSGSSKAERTKYHDSVQESRLTRF